MYQPYIQPGSDRRFPVFAYQNQGTNWRRTKQGRVWEGIYTLPRSLKSFRDLSSPKNRWSYIIPFWRSFDSLFCLLEGVHDVYTVGKALHQQVVKTTPPSLPELQMSRNLVSDHWYLSIPSLKLKILAIPINKCAKSVTYGFWSALVSKIDA